MDLTQREAFEDIRQIRETIECSRRKYSGLYKLFFAYGILQGILFACIAAGNFIWGANDGNGYFTLVTEMIGAGIITVVYWKIYGQEKDTANRYYLTTISIWGMITILMPFLMFAVRLVIAFSGDQSAAGALPLLMDYGMWTSILLGCAAVITVGYLIDRRWMTVLAAGILLVSLMIRILPAAFTVDLRQNIIEIPLFSILYYVINIAGYIVLGFLLLYQEKKSGNSKHTGSI